MLFTESSSSDPLLIGYSYWVPPRRDSYGIAELVNTLSNNLGDDEVMSLTTSRGWPSSTLFDGTAQGSQFWVLEFCAIIVCPQLTSGLDIRSIA